jgi:hypothetical protein
MCWNSNSFIYINSHVINDTIGSVARNLKVNLLMGHREENVTQQMLQYMKK